VSSRSESHGSDAAPASMRLDLFLKGSRLIPRRSQAREVCERGAVSVNGHVAKSARPVKVGDVIEWRQHRRITAVRVSWIPAGRPGKHEAARLYEPVGTEYGERFSQ
jgi:ribosomal 50S subunit-recycling heat shock protein